MVSPSKENTDLNRNVSEMGKMAFCILSIDVPTLCKKEDKIIVFFTYFSENNKNMRRLDKEINDPRILHHILTNSQVVRVAFSIDDIPHILPLSFGHQENKLFIHSATEGTKIEMIKKNDYVCFEMELYTEILRDEIACNWTTKYRSIIGWGTIRIVNDTNEKIKGLDIIMNKYRSPGTHEYNTALLDEIFLLEIDIERITGKQSGKWE